jgi:hypothetical protein
VTQARKNIEKNLVQGCPLILCLLLPLDPMQRRGGWGGNAPGGRAQYISSSSASAAPAATAPAPDRSSNIQYSAEDAQRLIPGLRIVKDFISKEEEEDLLKVCH